MCFGNCNSSGNWNLCCVLLRLPLTSGYVINVYSSSACWWSDTDLFSDLQCIYLIHCIIWNLCYLSSRVIMLFVYFVFVLPFMKSFDSVVTDVSYCCDNLNLSSVKTHRVAWSWEIHTAKLILSFWSSCLLCGSVWALKQWKVETVVPRLRQFCHAAIQHCSVLLSVTFAVGF